MTVGRTGSFFCVCVLCQSHEDKPVQVCVFNEPRHIVRIVKLTPTQNWPGSGLLGISIALKRFSYGTEVDEEDKAHRRASGVSECLSILV